MPPRKTTRKRKQEIPDVKLFAPLGPASRKIYCLMCGPHAQGYPGGRWMERHRYGHGNCPRCGQLTYLLPDGRDRTHTTCPKRERT